MRKALFILLLLSNSLCFGQYDVEENKKDDKKKEKNLSLFELKQRIYVGGEFSLRFGLLTYLYISPIVGYDITEKFSGGLSTMYQLFRFRDPATNFVSSSHAYGGGVFLRYRPIEFLLLQTEFDLFNSDDFTTTTVSNDRVNVPVFMAGLGYAGSMGDKAYYHLMIMYDFIDDINMPLPRFFTPPVYIKYGFVFHIG